MRSHEMACCKCTAKTQFPGKNTRSHDASETARVIPGVRGVSTSNAKEIEHSALRLENSPSANGTHFDRWHRHADLKIAVVAERG